MKKIFALTLMLVAIAMASCDKKIFERHPDEPLRREMTAIGISEETPHRFFFLELLQEDKGQPIIVKRYAYVDITSETEPELQWITVNKEATARPWKGLDFQGQEREYNYLLEVNPPIHFLVDEKSIWSESLLPDWSSLHDIWNGLIGKRKP